MLQDIQDYDRTKAAVESGEEEIIPAEVVYALLDGENPVKFWREYDCNRQGPACWSG